MKRTALIMAGGKGERFWPKSRMNLPKQFLSLTDDDETMIQLTVKRIEGLVDIEDVYVVTNEKYKGIVEKQLPKIPAENIICEPEGRNTAPCIGVGCMKISEKYKGEDPTVIVLPSDHLIKHTAIFSNALLEACKVAETGNNLVTIGITPTYPETGYGYIKYNEEKRLLGAYGVARFVEKPDIDSAKKYLSEGTYLWNSGMFIWKAADIIEAFGKYLPDMYDKMKNLAPFLNTEAEGEEIKKRFLEFESVSIDYGIMEKADNIYIIPGNFGWDDVGSWLAVSRINRTDEFGNHIKGNAQTIDVENTTIIAGDRLVAAVGVRDAVIVDSGDAILIADKNHTGDIKKLLLKLKEEGKIDYL